MSVIPNVLAERYASAAMKSIWSAEGRIILEREFWIAVMKAQRDLGLDIPDGVIEAYERVKDQVNLPSIDARERVTRHDVKARIEEFCELAGCEHIHKGMTNLCAGGHNFHGKYEYVPVRSLEKISAILQEIVSGYARYGLEPPPRE